MPCVNYQLCRCPSHSRKIPHIITGLHGVFSYGAPLHSHCQIWRPDLTAWQRGPPQVQAGTCKHTRPSSGPANKLLGLGSSELTQPHRPSAHARRPWHALGRALTRRFPCLVEVLPRPSCNSVVCQRQPVTHAGKLRLSSLDVYAPSHVGLWRNSLALRI